jgi:hypothetical protein
MVQILVEIPQNSHFANLKTPSDKALGLAKSVISRGAEFEAALEKFNGGVLNEEAFALTFAYPMLGSETE